MIRRATVLVVAAGLLFGASILSIRYGTVDIPFDTVRDTLLGKTVDPGNARIVNGIRVPSLVEALLVGSALGVAGAVLQGALQNPLASPDVIGVTAGAGFGATLILLAFPSSVALLPLGALAFGLLAAVLVFAFAWTGQSRGSVSKVILAGIAIAAIFGAGTTSLLVAYPDRVQSVIFFLAGGLTPNGWIDLREFWPYFAAGGIVSVILVRPLDRLALGDDVAASLGSRPLVTRLVAGLAAALLASAAAALAGLLGFLGLIVPHLVRMAGGTSRHAFVIPASALVGATLLVAADLLARTIASVPLPVGPFLVVLGVPLFLWLLRRQV
ncbi:MAG: iron ABC transporter permease [Solirubrobacterales bacterium]